jgi:hypothetical protein
MSVSYKNSEVQAENSSAMRQSPDVIVRESYVSSGYQVKEASAMSSNLLDYLGENRLK